MPGRDEQLSRFRKHFGNREYLKALEICVKMVEADPRDARALRNLGAAYMALDYNTEAESVLKRALALDPGDAYARYNLGVIASRRGDHEEAIAQYERALDAIPDLMGAHMGIASSLYRLGDYDNALYHYSRAYVLAPDSPEVARSFGVTLMQKGQPAKAVFYLRQTLAAKPKWAEPRFELGEALRLLGSYPAAIRELLRGLRLKRTGAGLTVLGRVYLDCGKVEKAMRRLKLATALDPRNALAHRILGMCHVRLRAWPEALESLEEAYRLNPGDDDTSVDLASALTESGRDPDRACGLAQAAVRRDPRNPRALDVLGRCLLRQGKHREAADQLERARQLLEMGGAVSDSAIDVYRHLTEVYEAMGDGMMARDIWSRVPRGGGGQTG